MATHASAGASMPAVSARSVGAVAITGAWVSGLIGSFFDAGSDAQAILWLLTGIFGSAGGFLLAIRHTQRGMVMSAAGFGLLGALTVAGHVAGSTGPAYEAVGGAIAAIFLSCMWLIALQDWAPAWSRGAAALSGIFFAVYGFSYILGNNPDPDGILGALPWILFAVAAIGWAMTLMAEED